MDVWQCKRQLAYLLARATWADAPSSAVLTDAFVSEDLEGNFLPGDFLADGPPKKDPPFARVARLPVQQDGESLDRLAALTLRAFVTVGASGVTAAADGETAADKYDTHGENQVTGTLRGTDGAGGSTGRDVDEIVDRLVESALGDGQLVDSQHALQGEVLADLEADAVDGVQVLSRPVDVVVYNATRGRYYHPVFRPRAQKVPSTAFTIAGTALTGYTFTVTIDAAPTVFGSIAGATTEAAAQALAAAINAHAIATKVFAVAVRGVVTVGPLASTSLTTLTGAVTPGGTGGQASVASSVNSALLTWVAPPLRFDSLDAMIRRGATSGAAAPSTPAAGVGVLVNGRDLMPTEVRTVDHNVGVGTWNFAIMPLYAETPGGWPTVTVLGLTLAGYTLTVYTTAGNWTITVPIGATLVATATAIAAAFNAHANIKLYATATATGAVVTLQPIGDPAWLGVSIQPGGTSNQLDRMIGDRYARSTLSLTI